MSFYNLTYYVTTCHTGNFWSHGQHSNGRNANFLQLHLFLEQQDVGWQYLLCTKASGLHQRIQYAISPQNNTGWIWVEASNNLLPQDASNRQSGSVIYFFKQRHAVLNIRSIKYRQLIADTGGLLPKTICLSDLCRILFLYVRFLGIRFYCYVMSSKEYLHTVYVSPFIKNILYAYCVGHAVSTHSTCHPVQFTCW